MPAFRNALLTILGTTLSLSLVSLPAALAQEDKKEAKKQEGKKEEDKKEEGKKEEAKKEETKPKEETIVLKDGVAKVEGALKTDDEKDKARKAPCKIFAIVLKDGRNYTIDMVSKDLDSYLRLEDATGKELAKDDDSGGFVNARINFRCPTDGTYRVFCTTFAVGTGAFALTIQEISLVRAEALIFKDGTAKIEGSLTAKDPADAVQSHSVCKVYAIKLTKGKSYQIDMMSKDLDAFLRLEDVTGKELAKDDDSGEGHNARIQFTSPEDGEYRLIATTFFGGTGGFTIQVKEK